MDPVASFFFFFFFKVYYFSEGYMSAGKQTGSYKGFVSRFENNGGNIPRGSTHFESFICLGEFSVSETAFKLIVNTFDWRWNM